MEEKRKRKIAHVLQNFTNVLIMRAFISFTLNFFFMFNRLKPHTLQKAYIKQNIQ